MSKPNLPAILQNEHRLRELDNLLLTSEISYHLIAANDVQALARAKLHREELQTEYQERLADKNRGYQGKEYRK